MTLKELHFFYELAQTSQVTLVAQQLQVSQSAISLAIKSLEQKLGENLFDRVGKKLVLNERGRFFKEQTYAHYVALKDAQTLFQTNQLAGTLHIAASKTISNYLMPDIYFNFLATHKEVSFDINSINSTQIIEQIVNSKLDIGLIETNLSHSNIIKEHLCDDELIVVTSDKNSPRKLFIDTIEKKWILREVGSGTREIFIDCLGDMAKELDIFMELHSFQEIKSILLKNPNTISAISRVAVEKELKAQTLFEIKLINIEFKRAFSLIYHKDKSKSLLFNTFIAFLKKSLQT